jgi:hypothetical protein
MLTASQCRYPDRILVLVLPFEWSIEGITVSMLIVHPDII